MTTNEQKARFDAENTKQIRLKLNLNTDKDILARLDAQPKKTGGKQGYIKRLIRADIEAKRGKWFDNGGFDTCSVCGFGCGDIYELGSANYCPVCGAKMDAE